MIRIRPADERGHANHGWLDTHHTFSFADYYDPEQMGFRALRVINEDRVAPESGFGAHPHRDMEIVTYVLEGELGHKDSMGTGSVIRPGEVQRMSAGTGVTHSEWNHSKQKPVHLLQIWIVPERNGIKPSYEQKSFGDEARNQLRLVASPDARDGSVTIHQDAELYVARLDGGKAASHELRPGRHAWVQVVRGAVDLNGKPLEAGDGAAVSEEKRLALAAKGPEGAEVLVFDLA
jgi:redox-sensitive bicupin YhaK (pirin superfamily)